MLAQTAYRRLSLGVYVGLQPRLVEHLGEIFDLCHEHLVVRLGKWWLALLAPVSMFQHFARRHVDDLLEHGGEHLVETLELVLFFLGGPAERSAQPTQVHGNLPPAFGSNMSLASCSVLGATCSGL